SAAELHYQHGGAFLIQVSFMLQQFSVQQRRARGPANGVMRQHGKFPIEDLAWAQPSDYGTHPASTIHIKPGLRAIAAAVIDHRLRRSTGQRNLLRTSTEIAPALDDFIRSGRVLQFYRD